MKRNTRISEILRPLDQSPTQAYISNALQVADILEWILRQFASQTDERKVVSVYQTTFSISEEFLRRIYSVKKLFPARFVVIIDRKALQKTVDLWNFISRVYDEVWIADNHSKILLVDDGSRHAAMVTSQNLTRGNRAESSVISASDEIFFPLLACFNDLRNNNSAPMHDIMPVANSDYVQASPASGSDMLSEIERMAALFVPVSDIAVVLDINPARLRDMIADAESPVAKAYLRGKVKAKIAIRGKEMEFAQVGSPLGIMSVRENLVSMEADE